MNLIHKDGRRRRKGYQIGVCVFDEFIDIRDSRNRRRNFDWSLACRLLVGA